MKPAGQVGMAWSRHVSHWDSRFARPSFVFAQSCCLGQRVRLVWEEGDCGQCPLYSQAGTGKSIAIRTGLTCSQESGGEETDRMSEDLANLIFTWSAGTSF